MMEDKGNFEFALTDIDLKSSKRLDYEINRCSSYSANYTPENIMVHKPNDPTSRWSSESNSLHQYILIKLLRPAVLLSITFGKFEKIHVCNVKKFRIRAGLTEESMIHVLDGGLNNDDVAETFTIQHKLQGTHFPVQFIKIMPLLSWGLTFNYSIWYIALHGVDDPDVMKPLIHWYHSYREREATRLCLKHLRQREYLDAYHDLAKRSKVSLEHPVLSELHSRLVVGGKFIECELLLDQACRDGHFNKFISAQKYEPTWTFIDNELKTDEEKPGMRGGHQMVMDSNSKLLYLHGGWDGTRDLGDFWKFDVTAMRWFKISENVGQQGGPSPRSCHKIAYDSSRQVIYSLGRYIESKARTPLNLMSDFHQYNIELGTWTLISADTAASGGPNLLFDHQMVMAEQSQTLYVFGGRVLLNGEEQRLSGLFSCHIPNHTWTLLKADCAQLPARTGHAMIYNAAERCLLIFGGHRLKQQLTELTTYDINTGAISCFPDTFQRDLGEVPSTSCTWRATLDPELNEVFVLKGISKNKEKKDKFRNSLWVYNLGTKKWACVYDSVPASNAVDISPIPMPRYAHQLVYDHRDKIHYLFGGNSGSESPSQSRMDDFWCLRLKRPTCAQLLRKCKFLLRKQKYRELAASDPTEALRYLQTNLAHAVDHSNEQELKQFQLLPTSLFEQQLHRSNETSSGNYHHRQQLFDQIATYFPENMSQPRRNLSDLVPFD